MQAAACEPTSQQTLSLSILLHGTCKSYSSAAANLAKQLRADLQLYAGVRPKGVSVRLVSRKDDATGTRLVSALLKMTPASCSCCAHWHEPTYTAGCAHCVDTLQRSVTCRTRP
jgi:hypothetical protein